MITLARLFQNGITLQREKEIKIWGTSDAAETVRVFLNGESLGEYDVPRGAFALYLPPQKAAENAVLEIGNVRLENVDIGEVWIAGGQSNMEFYLRDDLEGKQTIAGADDAHLRQYTVGQYAYPGEREERPKDGFHFDFWFPFDRENAPYFTAVGAYFARELRAKLGVPVAILACNWGGTTALTWLARGDLESDPALCGCVREYDAYAAENGLDETDANRPGGLYETMLSEVSGFTARGVLWYQGESDDCRASLYAALFGRLVRRWRGDWEDDLPFLFVQLAPYGTDGGSNGNLYPGVRRAQELAAKTVPNAFMASISDVGEEDNIHPRQKRPVGHRLYLQALDKVYAIPTLSDAPTAIGGAAGQGEIRVRFAHADGLRLDGTELSALHVFEGGREAAFSAPRVEGDTLVIACAAADGKRLLRLAFAQTAYYKVNLYNAADIPAIPFEMEV